PAGLVKRFSVVSADREKPDPMEWTLVPPIAGTQVPLLLQFPEAMDRALLASALIVLDEKNRRIAGEVRITEGETTWQFVPDQNWPEKKLRIRVSNDLEDLAGNNLDRAFDQDVEVQKSQGKAVRYTDLPFVPRGN
ncbi:MAG: hypothetical protein AAF206_14465, partial [Bacteroidota bacterium]